MRDGLFGGKTRILANAATIGERLLFFFDSKDLKTWNETSVPDLRQGRAKIQGLEVKTMKAPDWDTQRKEVLAKITEVYDHLK